jgi:2'-5' RNA ligase
VAAEKPREAPRAKAAPGESSRRLFFALWPDESLRQAMARATREATRASGGRPVRTENLHLTLAFVGSVPESRLPELAAIGRQAAGPSPALLASLDLTFDHLAHWRAAQLLCALPAKPPAAVSALAGRLEEGLTKGGFAPDLESSCSVERNLRRPFRPHVTLVRKVLRPPAAMETDLVTWRFADFVLVDSETLPEGPVYSVLERFPLDP